MNIGTDIGLDYGPATRDAFGEALAEAGRHRLDLVVLDGDVANSTRTEYFAEEFPDRFFNVGIAESNLVGIAAGLAAFGKEVVVASFAAFLMCNAFDQLRMSVAYPRLNIKFVGSHYGINIGQDGPSQMGIEDMALARALPGFAVLCPADAPSTRKATDAMLDHEGPVYMRVGRPKFPIVYRDDFEYRIGKANLLRSGDDVTIIACGLMVACALVAAHQLAEEGIKAAVLDMHTVKPIDSEAIESAARHTGAIVTAEEHLLAGGMGAAVAQVVCRRYPVPVACVGLDDTYAESGDPEHLLTKYHLAPQDIAAAAQSVVNRKQHVST
ncbi:MAG: transketolase family protein [Phycisphaerae bacterium]|nr:transketolase family protein [Phycisphaerae bacterium]